MALSSWDDYNQDEPYTPEPWPEGWNVGDLVLDVWTNPPSVVGVILEFDKHREAASIMLPTELQQNCMWHEDLILVSANQR